MGNSSHVQISFWWASIDEEFNEIFGGGDTNKPTRAHKQTE